MNGPPKRRVEELEARRQWTERLNRFASSKTAKQRRSALEAALKINPGGALRELLEAWGYSASSRGRKAKSEQAEPQRMPARQKLEFILEDLYGKKPAPVPNLYKKLAGTSPATVKDACRIVAALMVSWPEPIQAMGSSKMPDDRKHRAGAFAESFMRELLNDLSDGRSHQWAPEDMEIRVFNLIDEERIGISHFIKEAGETDGALIVAGSRDILIGPDPVNTVRQFYSLTSEFVGKLHKGLLIFVFDAALFEAGENGYRLLYNLGLLSTAVTAFALLDQSTDYAQPIRHHRVDWTRWRTLSTRCCAVIRKPTLNDPVSGEFLIGGQFDKFIADWRPDQGFARLDALRGFVRFDGSHVLPKAYPRELSKEEDLSANDLYWDVTVRQKGSNTSNLEVEYFTPPVHQVGSANNSLQAPGDASSFSSPASRRAGRPPAKTMTIEEDFIYVVKRDSPGGLYDDAQRAIYMAAKARLNVDAGARHIENLNAAAALRQVGYEVLPISILMSLFPTALQFAATHGIEDNGGDKM